MRSAITTIVLEASLLAASGVDVAMFFTIDGISVKDYAPEKDHRGFAEMWVDGLVSTAKMCGEHASYGVFEGHKEFYGVIRFSPSGGSIWLCQDIPTGYWQAKVAVPLVTSDDEDNPVDVE